MKCLSYNKKLLTSKGSFGQKAFKSFSSIKVDLVRIFKLK